MIDQPIAMILSSGKVPATADSFLLDEETATSVEMIQVESAGFGVEM